MRQGELVYLRLRPLPQPRPQPREALEHSLDWTAGGRIELPGYPPRLVRQSTGLHGILHRLGHRNRVPRPGNGGVHQDRIRSVLIASVASEAVPTPASTMTGTLTIS